MSREFNEYCKRADLMEYARFEFQNRLALHIRGEPERNHEYREIMVRIEAVNNMFCGVPDDEFMDIVNQAEEEEFASKTREEYSNKRGAD